jgi:serpin B
MNWKRTLPILFAPLCAAVAAGPVEKVSPAVVKGNNEFAFDLYHHLTDKPGNLFLSPYSISTALAMTSAGARGKTAEQMEAVLRFPPQAELHAAFATLINEINAPGANRGYQLSTANALWGAKGYPFRPEFLKLARDNYKAELTNLDFAGDPEGARQTINRWVEKETQDKIKDLIAQGVLTSATRLVLTNAIYFKGTWAAPFKKNLTRDEPFRTPGGAKPKVPLMNQTAEFGYMETDDFQALELPYAGKELATLVLLPKKDDVGGLEKKLSSRLVTDVVKKLVRQEVVVHLPRFKSTSEFELSAALSAMGMPLAFSRQADFSGLTDSQEPLQLGLVIHKAFVDVNEEGTEAAAATAVGVRATAMVVRPKPTPVFRADRPFVYMIRDVRNGSVLFLGRLADPSH